MEIKNFKNLQFILEFINTNPGCTAIAVRRALATRNGKQNYEHLPYTWYFSSRPTRWGNRGPKKGYDYGYWVNLNESRGPANLQLTQAGLQKLNSLQAA
jgi:hypothetical protein